MPKYHIDSSSTIEALFIDEGDALKRAGFTEPDLSKVPEEYDKYLSRIATQEQEPEVING